MLAAKLGHRHTAFSLPQDRPSRPIALQSPAGQRMICASVYLLVFIQNLLMHLAEKILLIQPLTFGGDYRAGFARPGSERDYPLSNRCDEIEALVVFDDVLIPWENVLFHRQPRAATLIRATLHRYSAFAFIHRILTFGDMLIGAALLNVRQTGLDRV